MAKFPLCRPLNEGDLHDDLRTHPVRPNARQPNGFGEGRCWERKRVEPSAEFQQELCVEARADLSGKNEVFILEIADQQRTQTDPSALRIGEAADYKLLR